MKLQKIIYWILALCVAGLVGFGLAEVQKKYPFLFDLFERHSQGFCVFAAVAFCLFLVTGIIYATSLDWLELETEKTISAVKINCILWAIFWISWSIFCANLETDAFVVSLYYRVSVVLLVTIPGLIAFLISFFIRRQMKKAEQEDKDTIGPDFTKGLYVIKITLYSGFYGLICLPVYTIIILIKK